METNSGSSREILSRCSGKWSHATGENGGPITVRATSCRFLSGRTTDGTD